ncbi:MAG: HAD family hydrolase, partial [Chloroflexi bacterium]|nr:HAD family hydrolase [Chloroflexota bacterium]
WASFVGMSTSDFSFDPHGWLEAQLGRELDRAGIRVGRLSRFDDRTNALGPMPGVKDYIEAARRFGFGLAIASSSPHSWVDRHLKRLGLSEQFQAIQCREDVAKGKPDPDLYQAAVAALGLVPAEAIAIEDSAPGVAAAKRAGLYCIVVPTNLTRRSSFDQADLVIDSLATLPLEGLLAKLRSGGRTEN